MNFDSLKEQMKNEKKYILEQRWHNFIKWMIIEFDYECGNCVRTMPDELYELTEEVERLNLKIKRLENKCA